MKTLQQAVQEATRARIEAGEQEGIFEGALLQFLANETDEPRYTLAEATMEFKRRQCAQYGHEWSVIESLAGPISIICGNCGKTHLIHKEN